MDDSKREYLERRLANMAEGVVEDSMLAVTIAMSEASKQNALGNTRVWLQYNEAIAETIKAALPQMIRFAFEVSDGRTEEAAPILSEAIAKPREDARAALVKRTSLSAQAFGEKPMYESLSAKLTKLTDQAIEDFKHGFEGGRRMKKDDNTGINVSVIGSPDFQAMETTLRARFSADHIDAERVAFARRGDLRYVGQGYELHVPFPQGEITTDGLAKVWQAFHAAHQSEYGQAFEGSAIEIVNARVIGTGRIDKIAGLPMPRGGLLKDARVKVAPCLFRVNGRLSSFDTTFYRREKLAAGERIPAPAIVLQIDSTTVIPPGADAVTDEVGNIIITFGTAL